MRLYATIDSDRGSTTASRGGNRHLTAHVRGWTAGVRVIARGDADNVDRFEVWQTSGSNGGDRDVLLGVIADGRYAPADVEPAPDLADVVEQNEHAGPIPAVDDDHPDSDGSDQDAEPDPDDEPTYEVVRFFRDPDTPSQVILDGVPLDEARRHCSAPDTHGDGWFDGYRAT